MLVESLFTAIPKIKDKEKRQGDSRLLQDILKMPDSFRDYRERLKDESCDTSKMRGMGAAESNVDRFSNRLKKRGQSWVPVGATAMAQSLMKYRSGSLERCAEHVSKMGDVLNA
ncbi:MAG TPA: UPF0236 family protein [Bacillota bacterium]|nr:UPF0236 family protein [Bacillota bacterium]